MATVTMWLDGEEITSDVADSLVTTIKDGLNSARPFSFTEKDGTWNWANPENITLVSIEV